MNFKALVDNSRNECQQAVGAIQSFKEYLDSFKNKLTKWLSLENTDEGYTDDILSIPVQLPIGGGQHKTVLAALTPLKYQWAILEPDAQISLPINEEGDGVTITGAAIADAVEDIVNESSIQSEFISECLEKDETSSDSFLQRMSVLNRSVSGAKLNEYAELLKTGDPITALQSLFSTIKLAGATKSIGPRDHEMIELSSASNFTGANIWLVAWDNLWGKITGFFNATWLGLSRIGEFLKNVLDNIISAAKYLVSLVVKPLFTRFEKGSCSIGIMDLPLLQVDLGYIKKHQTYDYYVINYAGKYSDVYDGWNNNWWRRNNDGTFRMQVYDSSTKTYSIANKVLKTGKSMQDFELFTAVYTPCIERIDDVDYFRPYDVVIPCEPFNFIARFGVRENDSTEDGIYIASMMIYACIPYASIKNLTDGETYNLIKDSCTDFLRKISCIAPIATEAQNEYELVTKYWLKNVASDASNVDIVGNNYVFDYFTFKSSGLTPTIEDAVELSKFEGFWVHLIHDGILRYALWNGPGYTNYINNDPGRFGRLDLAHFPPLYSSEEEKLEVLGMYSDWYNTSNDAGSVPVEYYNSWENSFDVETYRPFVQNSLYGASVHYQTLYEAADELIKYVIVMVIAAAAVFVAVKYTKFRNKRLATAEIQQGYVDNMAWNLPINPTKQDLLDYNAARRRAKRTQRINSMLGLSSPASESYTLFSSILAVRDQLLATQGVVIDSDTPSAVDFKGIYKAITGSDH